MAIWIEVGNATTCAFASGPHPCALVAAAVRSFVINSQICKSALDKRKSFCAWAKPVSACMCIALRTLDLKLYPMYNTWLIIIRPKECDNRFFLVKFFLFFGWGSFHVHFILGSWQHMAASQLAEERLNRSGRMGTEEGSAWAKSLRRNK